MIDRELVKLGAQAELARRHLYDYCRIKDPKFYAADRPHLKLVCDTIQDFISGSDDVLIIDLPPRHGKSYTLGHAVEWLLGRDPTSRIMTGSYNETLSTTFSKKVRDDIMERKVDQRRLTFSDVFPGVRIKPGDGAMNLWSLEGHFNNYLATSPTGTATGFGASLIVIDDLIKNAEEANSEIVKDKQYGWFRNTMLSRLETGGKIILVMTRWASDDLVGRALEDFGSMKMQHINLKALQDDGTMLCAPILSREDYNKKRSIADESIFYANYQQEPLDVKGRLYEAGFKVYTQLPVDNAGNSVIDGVYSYTDTADAGTDYLCTIVFAIYQHEAYVLDVYYTQAPMEVTEPVTADLLSACNVGIARIESNNGGSGFARSVQRRLNETGNYYTSVTWFHQTKNKVARINSNAAWCMRNIYFPAGWSTRWPEFYLAITKYNRAGGNKHDDAPDALTGVAETVLRI